MNRFFACALVFGFSVMGLSSISIADVTCSTCRVTVHTNGPTTCPVCGRTIGLAPQPQPQPHPHPHPNPYPNPGFDSGFKLGVSVVPMSWGLRVVSTQPGTPAHGVLFVDDIMQEAAYRDDFGNVQRFALRVPHDIETVKHYAGSSKQVALKVRRPTGQMRYLFASFIPNQTGPVRAYTAAPGQGGVRTRAAAPAANAAGAGQGSVTVDNTGAAAAMFGGAAAPGGQPGNAQPPVNPSGPGQPVTPSGESAADLFRQP